MDEDTTTAAMGSYKLDMDTQKRNVFVTQLHEREDEDDIVAFPVVRETGDKLIETGINTLQRTLLLKKQVEEDRVEQDLEYKRHEFKRRMEECEQRQIEVQKKQQRMKDRTTKFEKFIKENEAKRRRAIQKYQQEVKLKEQKTNEFEQLVNLLEELKLRHTYLQNKLARYKRYEEYLLRVVDALPEEYIRSTDNKLKGLMMRHKTLSDSNQDLVDKLDEMFIETCQSMKISCTSFTHDATRNSINSVLSDRAPCWKIVLIEFLAASWEKLHEELKTKLENLKQENNKQKVSINSQLAILQKHQEGAMEQNEEMDQKFNKNKGDMVEKRTQLGIIMMAIDNIAEKCRKRPDQTLQTMTLDQKLYSIQEHVNERIDVSRMASASPTQDSVYGGTEVIKLPKLKKTVTVVLTSPS